ncbi:hypothetical protein H1R20_g2054, partial [Candolleomyces eurysporus]
MHTFRATCACFGIPWLLDVPLEAAEIVSLIFILKGNYHTSVGWQYQPNDFWLRISTYYILIVSLGFLILIRVAWVTDGWSRGASALSRMDIREKRHGGRQAPASIKSSSSNIDIEKVGRRKKLQSSWALTAGALAGRSIWRRQIAGEPRFLAVLRGIVFIFFLALLVGFLFFMAVMDPIKELALTSSKMFQMKSIPWGMPPLTEDNKWIVRVKQPKTKDNMMYSLADAVQVYPLWETPSQPSSGSERRSVPVALEKRQGTYSTIPIPSQVGPPSSAPNPPPTSTTSNRETSSTRSVTRSATSSTTSGTKLFLNALDNDSPDTLDQAFPDLLVVVDFAALGKAIEPSPTAVSQINVRHHSVHVALALTDDVDEINEFIPVTLVPGINLLGIADLIMRQRSTQPVLSTIGWPDLFDTSMAAELAYVVNDPHASLFDLPPGPNIATIRFSARNKATTWRVKQDAREKSVLSGLSSVGGLGSLLGTVFLFLFGSSLLGIMFGMKPLSPFGLFHSFCPEIAQGSQQRYASLRTDIGKIYAEGGVMKYLFDVLIDIDLIVKAIIVEDNVDSDEFEGSTSSLGGVAGSVNEVESDNEVEDGAIPQSANSSQPLMNESRRASS